MRAQGGAWAAWLLSALTAAALGLSLVWQPAPPPRYQGLVAVRLRIPDQAAGFNLVGENPVSEPVKQALAEADLLSRTYHNSKSDQTVDFTLIGGTDRSSLHDPRSCLIGAGWQIEGDHVETLPGTTVAVRVCRVLSKSSPSVAGPSEGYEALYLYVVDGKTIHQVTEIRAQMLLSAMVGRKQTPVCFVRFMRPLQADPAADAVSRQQFLDFARQMWKAARIPESQTAQSTR